MNRNVRTAITLTDKYSHCRAEMHSRYCFVTFGAASLKASKHFLLTVPSGVTIGYSNVLNVSILNMALSKHWHFPSSSARSISLHSRKIPIEKKFWTKVFLTRNFFYYFFIQREARIKDALINLQDSCVILAPSGKRLIALFIKCKIQWIWWEKPTPARL